jgi:predicted ATPase/DNA-binding SARP family transcriptional activator/DNA-binding CsgD family transcriptional regulator
MCAPAGSEYEGPRGDRSEAVRAWLLSGFRISVGSRSISQDAWHLRKAAALVKLLALAPGHRIHREQAMDLLWPDSSWRAASNSLRSTLHAARKVLDPVVGSRYLASEDEALVLCPKGDLWVDVDAFEAAAAAARRAKEPAAYRAAIELYSGELLPEDRYEEWAEARRGQLRRTYIVLLLEAAWLYQERGEYEMGIEALHRAVAEEPTREEAHAGLMRLYALSELQAEALGQYERLCEALSMQLGTEPAAATRRLRDEIAAGEFPAPLPLPASPPREGSLDIAQHNLPAPRTSFVGREHEKVEVKRLLAMTRLLTLRGAGGSGKSRLALEVARDLAGLYPDGVWLVELAALTHGALVSQVVAEILGMQEQPNRPLTATLAEDLRAKQMLIVMDNCEHLVEACARLVDVLLGSCSGVCVLATSRESLNVAGEVVWSVPPLSVPDAEHPPNLEGLRVYESARLFVERAIRRTSAFVLTEDTASAVAEICQQLDGMPLAIELAAAQVGTLAVVQISQRLGDSLRLLTGGDRTALPRQQTLRGTLDWSYDLLSEPEKRLFCQLSAFAGGWTLEAAEAVGECVEGETILELLGTLVGKSLVVVEVAEDGSVRYTLLEPVRQYARAKLEESGEAEAIRRRHATFFLALAEEAEPELKGADQETWLERLEAEHDNLRAALSWTMEQGEAELGLRLSTALVEFWHLHVHHSEAQQWLEGALAEEGASPSVRMKALERAGFLAWEQGDYERAVALGEEALTLARRLGDEAVAASALLNLGGVAMSQMEVGRASALLEEAVALRRASGDDWGLAHALFTLGMVAIVRRDHARAMTLHEESLALARKMRDEVGIVRALGQGALTALVRGDLRRVDELNKATLELSRRLGIGHYAVSCLNTFGASAALQGHSVRAVRLWAAEESLREAIGIPHMPAELSFFGPYVDVVRTQLGEAEWERAWREGQRMSMEEAIEYALAQGEEPTQTTAPTEEGPSISTQTTALTRREVEVAALVAQGLTNRLIATELSISEHTVANHVAKILRKLGLDSRSQITAWVIERRTPP